MNDANRKNDSPFRLIKKDRGHAQRRHDIETKQKARCKNRKRGEDRSLELSVARGRWTGLLVVVCIIVIILVVVSGVVFRGVRGRGEEHRDGENLSVRSQPSSVETVASGLSGRLTEERGVETGDGNDAGVDELEVVRVHQGAVFLVVVPGLGRGDEEARVVVETARVGAGDVLLVVDVVVRDGVDEVGDAVLGQTAGERVVRLLESWPGGGSGGGCSSVGGTSKV
jgi:hypothetical protein